MKASICYITGRTEPRLEWVLEAIARQRQPSDALELVVIDALDRPWTQIVTDQELASRAVDDLVIGAPKPTIWQGKHRVTSRDWWAMSNARNTALCRARHDYVAFLDDRCRLGPRWLEMVRGGEARRASVLAGAYEKHEDGRVTTDHRLEHAPAGQPNCGGSWLYGCTFAMPLSWALEVNGFEEGCDGLGMEDVIFGLHLHNAGHRIDFAPALFVSQERSAASFGPVYKKTDKGVSPKDKSHAALERFGRRRRTELTPDLGALRRVLAEGGDWPRPDPACDHRDWYDQQPIREM